MPPFDKPRIRKVGNWWSCSTENLEGFGLTPKAAYQAWMHKLNITSIRFPFFELVPFKF